VADLERTGRSQPMRHSERGSFDRETVNAILDAALLCHVGYVLDGAPLVTPTLFWRDGDRVFWHGSAASRALPDASGVQGLPDGEPARRHRAVALGFQPLGQLPLGDAFRDGPER